MYWFDNNKIMQFMTFRLLLKTHFKIFKKTHFQRPSCSRNPQERFCPHLPNLPLATPLPLNDLLESIGLSLTPQGVTSLPMALINIHNIHFHLIISVTSILNI